MKSSRFVSLCIAGLLAAVPLEGIPAQDAAPLIPNTGFEQDSDRENAPLFCLPAGGISPIETPI